MLLQNSALTRFCSTPKIIGATSITNLPSANVTIHVPQDLFGEVLNGVKKHGVKVEAYTTVGWDEDSVRKHPDWVMLNGDRQPHPDERWKNFLPNGRGYASTAPIETIFLDRWMNS